MHPSAQDLNESSTPYQLNKHRLSVIGFSSICLFAFYMFYSWLFWAVIPNFIKTKEIHLESVVAWEFWAILSIVAALVLTLWREIHFAYKSFWEAPKLLFLFFGAASSQVLLFYGYLSIISIFNLLDALLLTPYKADWVGYGLFFISVLPFLSYSFLFSILSESTKILLGEPSKPRP